MGSVSGLADIEAYAAAGVDRLMVVPWTRVRETVAALRDFAATFIGRSRGEP
jgi:hypothetical protein